VRSLCAADIGTELPPGIELRPVPDDLAARVPQTKDYSYAVTHDRVLLVGTSRGPASFSVAEADHKVREWLVSQHWVPDTREW
jgi:hypothetical protein